MGLAVTTGLISGLDIDDIVSKIGSIERGPIATLQKKEVAFQVQLTSYGNMSSTLTSLNRSFSKLNSVIDFNVFSTESTNSDILTASADKNAVSRSYEVTIQQLAQEHKLKSSGFTADETIGAGTMHISVGGGDIVDIVVSDTDTIDDISSSINNSNADITSSVIFDGTNYFFTVEAKNSGEDNIINISVTEDPADGTDTDTNGLSRLVYDHGVTVNLTETQTAQSSIIDIDSITGIKNASNVVTSAIDGVTLNLESYDDAAEADNTATITINQNTSEIIKNFDAFVASYNETIDFFNTQQSYNEATKAAGSLFGDSTTSLIRSNLRDIVNSSVTGVDGFSRLSDFGISLKNNKLEIDSSTLLSALNTNINGTIEFFTQTDDNNQGFAVKMQSAIDAVLKSETGTIAARQKGIQSSIKSINTRIESIDMRALRYEERIRAQFQGLELLLSEYQATGDYLTQQFAAISNLNK